MTKELSYVIRHNPLTWFLDILTFLFFSIPFIQEVDIAIKIISFTLAAIVAIFTIRKLKHDIKSRKLENILKQKEIDRIISKKRRSKKDTNS